jgi:hypothetical protein
MVMNFINPSWEPTHVTIGIIELDNTIGATMANKIKTLLDSFGLLEKVIACVKDEGFNLNTLTFSLIFYGFLFYLLTTMLICRVMF